MTSPTTLTVPKIKVLVFEHGRPARVQNVPASVAAFREIVKGEPIMVPLNKHYGLVIAKSPKKENNIKIIDSNDFDFGMLWGTCIAVSNNEHGVASLSEKDVVMLRGYLESRRVGVC